MRHFIATDRKGTLSSIRKTSAPAELSILDREDYSKSSVSSRSITRTSCPQVTSVFPHPDLCPRYENILIILSICIFNYYIITHNYTRYKKSYIKKSFLYVVAAGCRLTKDEKGSWWIHVGTKGAILACSKMKPVHSVFPKKVFMVN